MSHHLANCPPTPQRKLELQARASARGVDLDNRDWAEPRAPRSRSRPSRRDREAMIVAHVQLVRVIASRISRRLPSHVDTDELTGVGMLGLIDAVDRFDPERGTPFKAYAEIRVRGAIIDSLRSADWVPLVVRRKVARIERTRDALRRRTGRDPNRVDMAEALGMSPGAYDDLLGDAVVHHLVSLEAVDGQPNGSSPADRIASSSDHALDVWLAEEGQQAIERAVHHLPEMERKVLHLYYGDGLKYREIGLSLGVCESRVCQLRGQAIARLRKVVSATID